MIDGSTHLWDNCQHETFTITADGTRVTTESPVSSRRYRNGNGDEQTVSTGCRDKQAAVAKLVELERQAERIRSNIITNAEAAVADHQQTPLLDHIAAYIAHME